MFSSKSVKAITLSDVYGHKIFIVDPFKKISSIKDNLDETCNINMESGDTYIIKKPFKDLVKFIYG